MFFNVRSNINLIQKKYKYILCLSCLLLTASLQISYTDYKNIALVYMCYEPEVSGLCNRNRAHVSLLSRTISLTKAQRAVLMGHLDLACIEDGHIEQANTGKGYQYQPLPLNFRFSDSKQVIQFFK